MKIRWHVCSILLLCAAVGASARGPKDKDKDGYLDHSQRGGEFAVLNNLLMRGAEEIEYVGRAQVEVYGRWYEASRFRIPHVWVYVTLSGPSDCGPDHAPLQSCGAAVSAELEILVGRDASGEIHDEMLRRVRAYWAANRPGRGKDAKAEEHLNYGDGEYFMFRESRPHEHTSWRAKSLFWVDGKFVKFNLRRFFPRDKRNDIGESPISKEEAIENFVKKSLHLRPRAHGRPAKRMKGAFREEFLRLDAAGAFSRGGAGGTPDGVTRRANEFKTAPASFARAGGAQLKDAPKKGPDYSLRGGEYAVLNNLLMHDADRVEFAGAEPVAVYGKRFEASKFVVESRVTVPAYDSVRCSEGQSCPATERAEFEVFVGRDASGEIHDEMLRKIHERLSDKPPRRRDAYAEEHLSHKGGEYLMFQAPLAAGLPGLGPRWVVWVDGKLFVFKFRKFLFQQGYTHMGVNVPYDKNEALENFVNMRVTLRSNGVKLPTRRMSGPARREFLRLYEKGVFRRSALTGAA